MFKGWLTKGARFHTNEQPAAAAATEVEAA
jgi:hypothetical protein